MAEQGADAPVKQQMKPDHLLKNCNVPLNWLCTTSDIDRQSWENTDELILFTKEGIKQVKKVLNNSNL